MSVKKLALRFWVLHANPDVYGAYGCATALFVHAVLSLVSNTAFDETACPTNISDYSDVYAAVATSGLSGGCLLLILVTLLGSPASRRSPLRSAAWAFATCLVHFAFVGARAEPAVCVRALGGLSSRLRPQQPTEIAFWACTMMPEVWALASLAQQPLYERLRLVVILAVLLATGFLTTFSESLAVWISTLLVSCGAHLLVTFYMIRVFLAAYAQSKDSSTQRLVVVTAPVFVLSWYSFPGWWLIGQLALVSPESEQVGWRVIGFGAKFIIAVVLMFGSFFEQAKDVENELAVYEAQRRVADGLNEAKRLFIRYILHEIRVPLQGGQLAVHELLLGLDSGELVPATTAPDAITPFRGAAETALLSISAIGKLLDDFLSLAKIEDGRMTFEPSEISLDGWVREAVAVFTNALRAKGLQLRLSHGGDVPASMFTDGARLRQVLSNYISNAIKFSPQGGEIVLRLRRVLRAPTVVTTMTARASATAALNSESRAAQRESELASASTQRGLASRRISPYHAGSLSDPSDGLTAGTDVEVGAGAALAPYLLVSVTDCGPGISAHEIPQLFQPYAQLHAGVQQKGLGTGLGLAICKGIVELMGGAVGVSSQPGSGATFWFDVPMPERPPRATLSLEVHASPVTSDRLSSHLEEAATAERIGSSGRPPTGVERADLVAPFGAPHRGVRSAEGVAGEDARNDGASQSIAAQRTSGAHIARRAVSTDGGSSSGASRPAPASLLLRALPSGRLDDGSGRAVSQLPGSPFRPEVLPVATRAVVVDDVRSNRELFARLLRRAGVDVIFTAENGQDALWCLHSALSLQPQASQVQIGEPIAAAFSAASSQGARLPRLSWSTGSPNATRDATPSVAQLAGADALVEVWFVDGNMPVMDGLELARRLREAGVRVPIVAVTGNALAEDQAAFCDAGASTVLTKPFTATKLHEALARVGLSLPKSTTLAQPQAPGPGSALSHEGSADSAGWPPPAQS